MISHKYKCIFVHISKCAGSSIENAFGINVKDNSEKNNSHLFGWNENLKMFLQHATPQELIDNNLIAPRDWESYYKFIIVRNPWDRALSDYLWLRKEQNINDSFYNFVNRKGKFSAALNVKNIFYRGDHLKKQIDYLYFHGKKINFDRILYFENLPKDLSLVCKDLNLERNFFIERMNRGTTKTNNHYSHFYNRKRRHLIEVKYKEDIDFLNYSFEEKKGVKDYFNLLLNSKRL